MPPYAASAKIAVASSLKLKDGESILIATNPEREQFEIAAAIYDAAAAAGARAVLVVQGVKTQTDYAEESLIAAFESRPDVFVSLSAEKLGKDREGIRTPYDWNGVKYDHVFHYQLHGAKTMRAFWSPGLTRAIFAKTVPIDYAALKARCRAVEAAFAGGVYARVTNEAGTDIRVGIHGRAPKSDDGDFSRPRHGRQPPRGRGLHLAQARRLGRGHRFRRVDSGGQGRHPDTREHTLPRRGRLRRRSRPAARKRRP